MSYAIIRNANYKKDKNGKRVNKIACSEYWKGKDSYKQLQDNFYKYVTDRGFKLERGKLQIKKLHRKNI